MKFIALITAYTLAALAVRAQEPVYEMDLSGPPEKKPLEILKFKDGIAPVKIPGLLPRSLSDVFLEISYLGSGALAMTNGRLLTDDLFNGQPWLFGLKRYIDGTWREIQFEVSPWKNNITGVPEYLVKKAKAKGPVILAVKTRAQYRVSLTGR